MLDLLLSYILYPTAMTKGPAWPVGVISPPHVNLSRGYISPFTLVLSARSWLAMVPLVLPPGHPQAPPTPTPTPSSSGLKMAFSPSASEPHPRLYVTFVISHVSTGMTSSGVPAQCVRGAGPPHVLCGEALFSPYREPRARLA